MVGNERQVEPAVRRPGGPRAALQTLGVGTLATLDHGRQVAAYIGTQVAAGAVLLRHPRELPWRTLPRLVTRAGADAVPAVVVFLFCTGFILAFQLTLQLQRVGAGERLPGLAALAMVRELGPLMTALVVAGRSGAAIAADLADGGSEPAPWNGNHRAGIHLVWPHLLALVVALPLLVVLGDAAAIAGAAVFAPGELEIAPLDFVDDSLAAIGWGHLLEGLGKTLAYAIAIALIASYRGLAARARRQAPGAAATGAVVLGLTTVIALDAGITILLWMLLT